MNHIVHGPAAFDDFRPGDYVAHINLGDGTIERVDSAVHVLFDRDVYGHVIRGVYDRIWFSKFPGYLFHRFTE